MELPDFGQHNCLMCGTRPSRLVWKTTAGLHLACQCGKLAMPVIPAEMKVQYKDLRLKRLD